MAPGQSLRIKGDITAGEDLTITGRVEGRIDATGYSVRVAEGSNVVGNVEASSVDVDGQVQGAIVASECVRINARGMVEGDLKTTRLAVADGGFVKGKVEMTPSKARLHAVAS
jgi:cytoskeletal protein CcmA (bactofilin family)